MSCPLEDVATRVMDPTATRRGTFEARVLAVVRRIPSGRVATYGDIAALAGRPRAWRAVGTIMRTCRFPTVPCHRVIAAGGRVGGYSDLLRKRQLLQDEGIVVGRHTIRHFAQVRWTSRSVRRAPPA